MKTIQILAAAFVIGTAALSSMPAEARGGGSDIAEQREKFKAELRAARANDDCRTASLWGMMFGHDDDQAVAEAPASGATN